ncbi:C-type lectin domain family 4 member A-like isoform X11 [Myxocyprinus asiaticus]|uniref:C-type lectin domain family 4 member A-like isoform X11 n=1 Tax=Myxocyprinus asiaticus TaxID=70543 RepID=UPI002222C6C5|nr:C-type lectin domain family 4 member A-like isoform X11 [Myxocyprinus asiaticus]
MVDFFSFGLGTNGLIKMSDDVVYSDVIFVKRNGDKRNDTDQCHLGDSSKAMQKTKPCFDCVRLILMAFCILLMGGLIALSFQYVYTERKLKNLQQLHNVLSGNLTGALKDLHHCQQNLSKALNSACPKDWEYHAGKCYLFSTNTLNWTQSRDECVSGGGHLAIINSRDEQMRKKRINGYGSTTQNLVKTNDLFLQFHNKLKDMQTHMGRKSTFFLSSSFFLFFAGTVSKWDKTTI